MPDREKVILGLECCILRNPDDHARCSQCSYGGDCVNRLKMDALELLKAQEPLKPVLKKIRLGFHTDVVHIEPCCGGCGHKLEAWYKYCSYCGRAVKLDG